MRFLNPKTDFAFKKIFGSQQSKPILIDFLNALLYEQGRFIFPRKMAGGAEGAEGAEGDFWE